MLLHECVGQIKLHGAKPKANYSLQFALWDVVKYCVSTTLSNKKLRQVKTTVNQIVAPILIT